MIVVDTSVWIDLFRDLDTPEVRRLEELYPADSIIVGDIVLVEALMGDRDERQSQRHERLLRKFRVEPMLTADSAAKVAASYRVLRRHGVTIRGISDLIIGSFCIAKGYPLLTADRDFQPMAEHLGLRLA